MFIRGGMGFLTENTRIPPGLVYAVTVNGL